MLAYFLYK